MIPIEETPAGVADEYTERIKALRAHEVRELENSEYLRPVKHIRTALIDLITTIQEDINSQENSQGKQGSTK
jgi:hypothetical protein